MGTSGSLIPLPEDLTDWVCAINAIKMVYPDHISCRLTEHEQRSDCRNLVYFKSPITDEVFLQQDDGEISIVSLPYAEENGDTRIARALWEAYCLLDERGGFTHLNETELNRMIKA
jgi:hypothetical protein